MVDLHEQADILVAGLETGEGLEVSATRMMDHEVECDRRGRIVSTDWCVDEFVSVRRLAGDGIERYVTLPASSDRDTIEEALRQAPARRDPPPMCDADAGALRPVADPHPGLAPIQRALERLADQACEQVRRVVHPGDPGHAHSVLVRDRASVVRNSLGGSAYIDERHVRLRQALAADGLTWHDALCYQTAYAGTDIQIAPSAGLDHSGRFAVPSGTRSGSPRLVVQGDVMVELLAVWARAPMETRLRAAYSTSVSIAERPVPFRTPSVDDAGRAIDVRWHVRGGEVVSRSLAPQGAYRATPEARLDPAYSALVIEPSTSPSSEILAEVDDGFYASQAAALVIGEDSGEGRSLQLRLGGFDIEAGALVGPLRWIDGRVNHDDLFGAVSALGDRLYWGRWKWADGWYASPVVVFDRSVLEGVAT
jgi:hypothetical protein